VPKITDQEHSTEYDVTAWWAIQNTTVAMRTDGSARGSSLMSLGAQLHVGNKLVISSSQTPVTTSRYSEIPQDVCWGFSAQTGVCTCKTSSF